MKFHWPDLYFGPINLWSAPWLGREYFEWRLDLEQQRATKPPILSQQHVRMNEILQAK